MIGISFKPKAFGLIALATALLSSYLLLTRTSPVSSVDASDKSALRFHKDLGIATPGTAVAVAWSEDGSALAVASNWGLDLTVWDRSGKLLRAMKRIGGGPALSGSIGLVHGATEVLFLPPEDSPNTAALSIWSVQTGEIVGSINGPRPDLDSYPENRADHFSITPDHKTLVAGARLGGRLIIYNLSDWSPRATAQIPNCLISSVAAETNTNLALIGCSAGVASILDMSSGVIRNQLQAYEATPFGDIAITAICKNPNGSDVFVSGSVLLTYGPYVKDTSAINYLNSIDSARIIDSKNSNKIASLPAKTIVAPVTAAAWDPRGRYVAFVDGGGTLFIWQPNEGSGALQRIALRKPNVSLAISRDGARIAVTAGTGVSIYTVE